MFLEFWKRRQAVIAWEWDLSNYEDEEDSRPEFEVQVRPNETGQYRRMTTIIKALLSTK